MDATERAIEGMAAALFEANGNSLGAPWAGESEDVRRWYMEQARTLLRELGLVAVPRELVEAVERTSAECDGELAAEKYIGSGETLAVATPYAEACEAVATMVVAALRGTR